MDQRENTFLEHNWKYFELHANQRMQMFNFFIVVSTTISAGIGAFIKDKDYLILILFLCFALTLISLIFWKLDRRTSNLIKHVEFSMIKIESSFGENHEECKLFSTEAQKTKEVLDTHGYFMQQWSYSRCFNLMFITMGGAGLLGILYCISQFLHC